MNNLIIFLIIWLLISHKYGEDMMKIFGGTQGYFSVFVENIFYVVQQLWFCVVSSMFILVWINSTSLVVRILLFCISYSVSYVNELIRDVIRVD